MSINVFHAKNGIEIIESHNPYELVVYSLIENLRIPGPIAAALADRSLAERDEVVGRWRWPENSHYVVYEGERGYVSVINESTGDWATASRAEGYTDTGHGTIYNAIAAYFEAHPERKPRPWADAQFITWRDGAYLPQTAQRDMGSSRLGWRFGRDDGPRWISEDKLAEEIGSAEVTILVGAP